MSRVFVTDGGRFIGRKIGRLVIANGQEVKSLSRSGRPVATELWVDEIE